MKRCSLSVLLFSLVFISLGNGRSAASTAGHPCARPLRVLFIGNSYTYVNELPRLIEQSATSAKESRVLETEMVAVGGATLESHWEGGRALAAVRKGPWDFVVLQEQGTRPLAQPEVMYRYARLFDAEVKRAGAQTVFYLTWARLGQEQLQGTRSEAYLSIARELGARVAPIGTVWQQVRRESPGIKLYSEDGAHPSPAGTYLAACVFYVTFYGKSPEGLSRQLFSTRFGTAEEGPRIAAGSLSPSEAEIIQQTAWRLTRPGQTSASSPSGRAQERQKIEYQALSWSPDGKRVSFTARKEGNWDIYVVNVDGSNLTRLTDDAARDLYTSWSPDGKKIVFDSGRDGNTDIYVMGQDGANPVRLTKGSGKNSYPSWSPDGKRIAFMSNRDGKWQIYVMGTDGSNQTRVTKNNANDYNPSWSPGGDKLIFESDRDGGDVDEIYVINADGSGEARVTRNNADNVNDVFPTWLPEGSRISFSSVKDRTVNVYVARADGSQQSLLIGRAMFARWTPNGSRVAYISQGAGDNPPQIFVMNADGKNHVQLTR